MPNPAVLFLASWNLEFGSTRLWNHPKTKKKLEAIFQNQLLFHDPNFDSGLCLSNLCHPFLFLSGLGNSTNRIDLGGFGNLLSDQFLASRSMTWEGYCF